MDIDVIIPTYNNAHFLAEAIASVQQQTYAPTQIIVVDDGSKDDTEAVVTALKDHSTIPIVYIKKENGGPNSARNVGLAHATAELVAFLDADDRWESTKLEKQITLFEKDTEQTLGLVYGNYKTIDTTGSDRPDIPTVPLNPEIKGYAFETLLPGNLILGSASNVLIRHSVFATVGTFDESLRVGEDWDMWLRIAKEFRIDYVDEVLVAIRRHAHNQTGNIATLIKGDSAFIETWIPQIKDTYAIPRIWADRIVFNIIRGLPSLAMLRLAHRSLTKETRRILFRSTRGSLTLACIYFVIRALVTRDMRRRIFASLKRYATR
jgi:glycosyltransferase involved in cell wall biosynthesis